MVRGGSCAACKYNRKGCKPECVFKAYFPANNPKKFADIHKVIGARKVVEFIKSLQASSHSQAQIEEAVDSLSFESSCRIRDPVFGSLSVLSILQADLGKFERQIAIINDQIRAYATSQTAADHDHDHDLASQMPNQLAAAAAPSDAVIIPDPATQQQQS